MNGYSIVIKLNAKKHKHIFTFWVLHFYNVHQFLTIIILQAWLSLQIKSQTILCEMLIRGYIHKAPLGKTEVKGTLWY